jgi:hypothetical protein
MVRGAKHSNESKADISIKERCSNPTPGTTDKPPHFWLGSFSFPEDLDAVDVADVFESRFNQLGTVRRAIDIHEGDKINEDAFKKLIRETVALNLKSKKQSA